jgi:hypothetical protein
LTAWGPLVAALAVILVSSSSCCCFGIRRTGDSTLERNFARNEPRFDRLVADFNSDAGLGMVDDGGVRCGGTLFDSTPADLSALAQRGFTADRLAYYRRQLKMLGVERILRGDGDTVELPVDESSFLSNGIYKGYWHSTSPPVGHEKANLDRYQPSKEDLGRFGGYLLYKPIKPNWYLYLYIDGH